MNIAIVDDQLEFISFFEKVLKKYNYNITGFNNPFDFLENSRYFDVVFLDIEMPEINGIELCKLLNNLDINIIFITSHTEMMPLAFNKNVIGFIDKANYKKQLDEIISKIELINNPKFLELKITGIKIKIFLYEIIYLTYQYQDVTLHLLNKPDYIIKECSLKSIVRKLDSQFIIINRTTAVNLNFPFEYKEGKLQLNNIKLSVSRRNINKVKFMLLERDFKNVR